VNRPDHVYKWQRYYRSRSWRHRLNLPPWLCWEWPWQYYRRVWRHESQRVNNGYSWHDWISFDTFLCLVIADACRDFRENGQGYPAGSSEEEWNDVLTRIEDPLRWWGENKFDNELSAEGEKLRYEEAKDAMRLVAEHLGSLWD
jgi:hypothetical protein